MKPLQPVSAGCVCFAGIGQRAPPSSASDTSSAVNGAHDGRRAWEIAAAMERYFRSQDSWYASAGPRGSGAPASAVVPMLRLSDLDRARRAPDARAAAFERVQARAPLILRPIYALEVSVVLIRRYGSRWVD